MSALSILVYGDLLLDVRMYCYFLTQFIGFSTADVIHLHKLLGS